MPSVTGVVRIQLARAIQLVRLYLGTARVTNGIGSSVLHQVRNEREVNKTNKFNTKYLWIFFIRDGDIIGI
jgi:hypothetical protein